MDSAKEPTFPADFPYNFSFSTSITAHRPPQQFSSVDKFRRPRLGAHWLSHHRQLDLVLRAPPLEPQTPLQDPDKAHLTFVEPIRLTPCWGAQLFLCDITYADSRQPERWVAKVYDPLYFQFILEDPWNPKKNQVLDVTWGADYAYSNEAITYEHLNREGLAGSITPLYGGSWTFDLPVARVPGNEVATCVLHGEATSSCSGDCDRALPPPGVFTTRPVRMVLVEHLRGETMRRMLDKSTSGPSLSDDVRMGIWAQFLHGKVLLIQANVLVGDMVPRNIMVCTRKGSDQHRLQHQQQHQQGQCGQHSSCVTCAGSRYRVVFFDFDRGEIRENARAEKPNSPMWAYWDGPDYPDFKEWLPSWYKDEQDPSRRRRWLIEQFGGAHAGEYAEYDKNKYRLPKAGVKNPSSKP